MDVTHAQCAIEIKQRRETVLELIGAGQYSTPQIADETIVMNESVSQCIETLRKQGHGMKFIKIDGQWCYRMEGRSRNNLANLAKTGKS